MNTYNLHTRTPKVRSRAIGAGTQILRLSLLVAILTGCVKPKSNEVSKDQADAGATFVVSEVKGVLIKKDLNTDWNLPKSVAVNYSFCITDRRTNEIVKLGEFSVVGGPIEQNVQTDQNGCAQFEEVLELNAIARAKYIGVKRSLHGKNLEVGSRTLSLAVNPWDVLNSANSTAVIDLNKHKDAIPEEQIAAPEQSVSALNALNADGTVQRRVLGVDDFKVQISDENTSSLGKDLSLNVSLSPKVVLNQYDGTPFTFAFKKAKANISLVLISSVKQANGETKKTILARSQTPLPVAIDESGSLRAEMPVHIGVLPSIGNIEIAFKVTPVNGPANLEGYEGVSVLNEMSSLIGMHTTAARPEFQRTESNQFSIADYTKNSKDASPEQVDSGQSALNPFETNLLEIIRDHVESSKDTQSHRSIAFNVRACVTNPVLNTVMRGLEFSVSRSDGTFKSIITDQFGCMSWAESLSQEIYANEKFVDRFVTISMKNGFSQKIGIRLNPWDEGSGFGRDMRAVDPELEKNVADLSGPTSSILLTDYKWEQVRSSYRVDEFLQIHVTKSIRLMMSPQVIRASSLTKGRSQAEPLRDGRYLLRIAVRNEPLNSRIPETLSVTQKAIQVVGGLIDASVDLQLGDNRLLTSRSQLYIEILPLNELKLKSVTNADLLSDKMDLMSYVDSTSGLLARTFVGQIVTGGAALTQGTLRAVDELQQERCQQAECTDLTVPYSNISQMVIREKILADDLKSRLTSLSDERVFAQSENAHAINLGTSASEVFARNLGVQESELNAIVRGNSLSSNAIRGLCRFWATRLLSYDVPEEKSLFAGTLPLMSGAEQFYNECVSFHRPKMAQNMFKIISKNPLDAVLMLEPFIVDRKIRAIEVASSQRSNGRISTLVVGSNFSATYDDRVTWSMVSSVGAKAWFGEAVGAGAGVEVSRTGASTQSVMSRYSVTAGTNLQVESIEMQVNLNRSKRCATFSLSNEFLQKKLGFFDQLTVNPNLSQQEKLNLLTRSIILCAKEENAPQSVMETYFYISQDPSGMVFLDRGDVRNQPWMAVIRGVADFEKFRSQIRGKISPRDVDKTLNFEPRALERLNNAFTNQSTSYPGYFTVQ